jgi:hypothetical protein
MLSPHPDRAVRCHALLAFLIMASPYVEQTTAEDGTPRVRLHLRVGSVWTMWDATFSQFRHDRLPHGDRRATDRVFVGAEGTKRLARLGATSDRGLEPNVLALQLRGAEYAARDRSRSDPEAPRRVGG